MELQFGACCPPLSKQLKGLISLGVGEIIDRNAEAIDRLRIRGLLSGAEVDKARCRLIRLIEREAKMERNSQKPKAKRRRRA